MSKLSKEQFKKLEPLEVFLNQSRHDYLVNQSMVNKEIVFEIHRKIFGGDIGKITCPTCVLRTYRRVAELYFEYKDSKKEEKQEEKQEEIKEEIKEDSSLGQDITEVQEKTKKEKTTATKNKSIDPKKTSQDKKKIIKK